MDLTQAMLDALSSLSVKEIPTLEYLLISKLVPEIPDLQHEGAATDQDAIRVLVQVEIALIEACNKSARPAVLPVPSKDITAYRAAAVKGAHSFAQRGEAGLACFVAMLLPAVKGQLDDGRGDLDAQLQGVYTWIFMALVAGYGGKDAPIWAWPAIREALASWSEILVPEG